MLQLLTKDDNIRPVAAGEGAIDPNNISCYNTDTKLVAKTRGSELERPKGPLAFTTLLCFAVGAVNGYKTIISFVIALAICPNNLFRQESKSIERKRPATTIYHTNRKQRNNAKNSPHLHEYQQFSPQ